MHKRVPTGIPGLDKMLFGGFLEGRNILVSGPCGAGKTIFGIQFLYNGAVKYNEPGLYVTLEETKQKIFDDCAALGFNLPVLERQNKFYVIGGPIAKIKYYMDKVDAKARHIINEIGEVVKDKNVKRVVIDSLNLLTILASSDEERRRIIASLCNMLSSLKCTSLLISETEEGSMKLSRYGMEEFVVDGVVVLYLVRQGSRFISGIAIRKMRGTDHDKEIRVYRIGQGGIVVYPNETMFGEV